MIKTVFLCSRRSDITHERYARLLLEGHVPIALRHHPAMRRYVVNVVDESLPPAPERDSVGELWFDSIDDFRHRLYDGPEGMEIVRRDVAGFMGSADSYATIEHVQRPVPSAGARPAVKLVVALRRSPAFSREEFLRHWHDRHVPLVLDDPGVRGYVTSVVEGPLQGDPPPLDGIAELWFDSVAALSSHIESARDPARPMRSDLACFVGAAWPYRVSEHVCR